MTGYFESKKYHCVVLVIELIINYNFPAAQCLNCNPKGGQCNEPYKCECFVGYSGLYCNKVILLCIIIILHAVLFMFLLLFFFLFREINCAYI